MNLIVNEVMKLKIIHNADCNGVIKRFSRASVNKLCLTESCLICIIDERKLFFILRVCLEEFNKVVKIITLFLIYLLILECELLKVIGTL